MASAQADITFEKELFEAANRMRATVASADYKHIVLPLIFLRYLSAYSDDAVGVLGREFEYFIGNFASSEWNPGGQFFTPKSIVELLVAMLEPESCTIFDPACGSGGMFIQSQRYAKNKHALSFYGQESVDTTVRLGKMNVLIHGINADIRFGDSLLDDNLKKVWWTFREGHLEQKDFPAIIAEKDQSQGCYANVVV